MKKALIYVIIIALLVIVIKYRFSNYNVEYKINNFNIKTIYKNKRLYYEINDGERLYNFDIYQKRKFNKTLISKIEVIEDETFKCIYPSVNGLETYPLCYKDDVFTDYNLIDSELLETYKNETIDIDKSGRDYIFYNNLNKNEYVALWNYKGYIIMNDKSYNNVDLFTGDKYDNTLAYLLGDTIYMANNDEEHEYTSLVSLNIVNRSTNIIDLGYSIDFDSYIVGSIGKNLYIFDNKHSVLYEVNTKNDKTKVLANNEKGFVKYENGKFVSCSKNEYKVNKIKYDNNGSLYEYKNDNGLFKTISNNKNIKQKIINDNVVVINEKNNVLYYQFEDYFYKYEPSKGSYKVFYNFELNFNNNNTIFVYNK